MNEIEIWCKHFFFPRILLLVYVNECSFCWDNVSPNIQRSKVDVVGTTWIHSYGFKNDNINKPIVFKTKHEWDIFNRFSRSISSCCPDFFCHLFFLHHLSMICSTCFKKIFIPTKDTKYSLTNFFCTFIAASKKLETLNLNCFRVRSCVTIRTNIRTGKKCVFKSKNYFVFFFKQMLSCFHGKRFLSSWTGKPIWNRIRGLDKRSFKLFSPNCFKFFENTFTETFSCGFFN